MAYTYVPTGIAFVHVHPYRNEPHINVQMSIPMCSLGLREQKCGAIYACVLAYMSLRVWLV